MQSQQANVEKAETQFLLPPKKDQGLRRAFSFSEAFSITPEIASIVNTIEELNVECECCGMSEECTPTYISRIKSFFCGKWVCGLCTEAVKETMRRAALTNSSKMEDALESHASLCKQFNGTTRLNPKLSLAGAMREIARKSSEYRSSTTSSSSSSNNEQNYCKTGMTKIGRTVSCVHRNNDGQALMHQVKSLN